METALLALLALLQAADIATTAYALEHGLEEANPVVRKLFGRLSAGGMVAAAFVIKLLGSAPMVALLLEYPRWWPVPAIYAATLVFVVFHNLREILRSRSE